jgi:hypothetical protein
MSGPWYFCSWWRCRGTKLVPHDVDQCPHLNRRVPIDWTKR